VDVFQCSRLGLAAALGLTVAAASGCGDDDDDSTGGVTSEAVLKNYAANLYTAYSDSVTDAQNLKTALQTLVDAPTDANLQAARDAWWTSREHYMRTEGARFYDGPIDGPINDAGDNYEARVNSWPLDEAYIDYVVDGPTRSEEEGPGTGGIIGDASVELTPEELDSLLGQGGDENVSDGWHAIEFLLWGQAHEDVGPGDRPASDYDPNATDNPHHTTAVRRGQYVLAAADGIIQNLTAVRDAWADGATYRAQFESGGDDSLTKLLTGLGKMSKGELAGERINAGLESKARRDQHDCFSSKTVQDYVRDAQGLLELYQGSYGDTDGPGVDELVNARDADTNAQLTAQLQASIDGLTSITVPFEQAIQGADTDPDRAKLISVRDSLRKQGDLFGTAASALGISLTVPDSND